jgi:hypothetical protein
VNLWIAAAIVLGAVAGAVAAMFLVRRRAPLGGFFTDSDRAAGVFGVLGTSFAVLLAFVIFLAFESYGNAKENAGQEAVSAIELDHTAKLFRSPERVNLGGQLICYARAVISDEWPAMRHQRESKLVQGWLAALDTSTARLDIRGQKQVVAYAHWLDQNSERREGRRGRLAEAAPFVPIPIWLVLIVGAVLLVGYMCFYADRGERFVAQAMMIGAITAIVVSGLLVVRFLDRPYQDQSGSIKPVQMRQTLKVMEQERRVQQANPRLRAPCDADGRPLRRS